jgi:Pectate lyase superfamily protein
LAIVQISRITQRKGLQEDLPQLAGAEFGWSVDERRLYIGNGTLEEGAPIIGNTEILTEFSDIIPLVQDYTYSGEAATGYAVQTSDSPGTPVKLSLQNWMDQFATVKDFGAVGDGIEDDTLAINRALYQLYCREVNPAIRRSLFFPAGVYRVSGAIVVPPYATLIGEGPDNTIIQMVAGATAAYVMQTGDSLQQTGVDIGTNGATPPQSITVEKMRFQSLDPMDIALIDRASQCIFNLAQFVGPLTTTELTLADDDTAGIRFASSTALATNQIKFNNCTFAGTTYGITTDQQARGIGITASQLSTLHKGIVIEANSAGDQYNPQGFGITNCNFDTIYAQGIVVSTERNATAQNTFGDVGNHFGGIAQPYTAIIEFLSPNNISVGDLFERSNDDAVLYPRIQLNDLASIAFTNGQQLAMGSYVRASGLTVTLTNNVISPTTAITYSLGGVAALGINYTIVRGTVYRTGVINIATTGGSSLNYTDDFTENASTGITLTVTQTGSTVFVKYISTNTGVGAELTYSITHLA